MMNSQQSQQVLPNEAANELLRRRKARTNLQDFILYLNPDYIVSDFSKEVCTELDELLAKAQRGERPVLVLGAPPQHGKSDIVSRYLPAFYFGKYPDNKVAGISYAADLANDMNRDVQRIMMKDEYKILFPESALNSKYVGTSKVEAKRNSETFEVVGYKGAYYSQGVGGPLTGKKVDLGIIDDPIKNSKEALSSTVKQTVWKWYVSTFLTRLSKRGAQIIMATRWAVDDLSGLIIKNNPNAKILTFPAINKDGKALIPELHPIDKLLETKKILGSYFWSAMYQQNPFIEGGGIIRGDWFGRYFVPSQIKYRKIFADTAQKTKEHNDYSVFECWGLGTDNKLYLLDMIRGKWEAPELKRRAVDFWQKHKAQDITMLGELRSLDIEDKASGTGLIQDIKREAKIPIRAIQRSKDKYTRVLDVIGYIESGYVMLPNEASFTTDFIAECELFSADGSHVHDDQVDPLCDAIVDMLTVKSKGFFGMELN